MTLRLSSRLADSALLCLVYISLGFFGCSVLSPQAPPRDPLERLRYELDAILTDSLFVPARASLKVKSLQSGEVLYDRDSKLLMRPASNTKLLTSAAALALLGVDFRFKTTVSVDSPVLGRRVVGNLYLKGYGDPDLTVTALDSLALLVKSAGIDSVAGNLVVDVSYFDDLFWGNGWQWDDEPWQYAAFISPLSVNDNCVKVSVSPGRNAGEPLQVVLSPATSYVEIVNRGITVTDSVTRPLTVTRLFRDRLNTILIEGEMLPTNGARETILSVWQPHRYAGTLFAEALQRHGVWVGGRVVEGVQPAQARELGVSFRTMDSVIVNLNKVSDNLSAENVLKAIGAVRRGPPGSAEQGLYEMRAFLSSLGIDTTAFRIVDGSGLSYYNLLTAEMLVQLLDGMARREELFPLYFASLPVAGVDGTLRTRMRGTAAQGNLRAKTGSIGGVSTLSGYVTTRDGEVLAFSMLMQNFLGSNRPYRDVQDRIADLLARFSRRAFFPL